MNYLDILGGITPEQIAGMSGLMPQRQPLSQAAPILQSEGAPPAPRPGILQSLGGALGKADPMALLAMGAGILGQQGRPGSTGLSQIGQGISQGLPMALTIGQIRNQREQQRLQQQERESLIKERSSILQTTLKNLDVDGDGNITPEERALGGLARAALADPTNNDLFKEVQTQRLRIAGKEPPGESTFAEKVRMFQEANPGATPSDAINAILAGSSPSVTVNLPGETQQPTNSTLNTLQGNILGAQQSLRDLGRIGSAYSDEYLTAWGRFKSWTGALLDKLGSEGEWTKFNAQRGTFVQDLRQFFNRYKKEITGAAAGEKEMEMLLDSMINEKLGPTEFASRFNSFVSAAEENLAANQAAASGGIQIGAQVQDVASEAEAEQLPVGTRFRLPDGRTGTVY